MSDSQVHFIFVKDPHCPSSSVCAHVTIGFSTTFLLLPFLHFFILCGSAPPPSIRLQHQCFHFLPPPSQPPLTVHFSFCHSSPLVFNLLCLFPPTLSLPVTIILCHYISFSLCLVCIGPAETNFGTLSILLERTVNKPKIFKTVLLHIFILPKF